MTEAGADRGDGTVSGIVVAGRRRRFERCD